METQCYKHPIPTTVRPFPGSDLIKLYPLSQYHIEQTQVEAKAELPEGIDQEHVLELAAVKLLSKSSGINEAELIQLYPHELDAMVSAWTKTQKRSHPKFSKLRDWLRKRVNDDPEIIKDGAQAYHAGSIKDYYGQPINELTFGQVSYYLALTDAFHEFHVDNKGKMVSKKWLQGKI